MTIKSEQERWEKEYSNGLRIVSRSVSQTLKVIWHFDSPCVFAW